MPSPGRGWCGAGSDKDDHNRPPRIVCIKTNRSDKFFIWFVLMILVWIFLFVRCVRHIS